VKLFHYGMVLYLNRHQYMCIIECTKSTSDMLVEVDMGAGRIMGFIRHITFIVLCCCSVTIAAAARLGEPAAGTGIARSRKAVPSTARDSYPVYFLCPSVRTNDGLTSLWALQSMMNLGPCFTVS
jgi:hypothetical protein